jgi:hypothetical protein
MEMILIWKKTSWKMIKYRFYRKNSFSPPKCSNHRQMLKNQGPKQTQKVLKIDQNLTQFTCLLPFFWWKSDNLLKNPKSFVKCFLTCQNTEFCKSFFGMTVQNLIRNLHKTPTNWGQKVTFMTIRKWCRISGPCRHYYIAKSDIFRFFSKFCQKSQVLWNFSGPKRVLFAHETPYYFVKKSIFLKKLKFL